MIVCKCDRCGKEIQDMHSAMIVQIGAYYPGTKKPTQYELCGWCASEVGLFINRHVEPVVVKVV